MPSLYSPTLHPYCVGAVPGRMSERCWPRALRDPVAEVPSCMEVGLGGQLWPPRHCCAARWWRTLSEPTVSVRRSSCGDANCAPWKHGLGAGAGITCPAQPMSVPCSRFPLDRRKSHTWRARLDVLASRVKLLPGDALSGLEQACLFSAVLQSRHAHNNGGQETRAGSMWYLVSVIFCNTYVLPVEMAEVGVFVSRLIHLASPRCLCLSGSRWSFVFWDPLSLRPYLCLTGQGIYNLLPLLCKSYFPPGSQRAAPTAPVINQLLLKPRTWMLHNTDLFHFWKYRIQPPPPFYPLLKVVKSSALLSIQQQLFVEVEEVIHNKTEDCAVHCTLDFKIYPVYNFKCENGIPWKHRDRLHLRSLPAFL